MAGQQPHDALTVFKATLLGQWHSLPGPALEVALRVRIGSVVSCGLGLAVEPRSADKEAAWLKKGKRSHYGYRRHVTVDGGNGHVRGVHTAPANESEVGRFEGALKAAAIKAARVLAGKGYASAANRKPLKAPAQMRHHAQGGTQQTLDGKAKTGEPLDRQKALYRRAMFRDDEAAVRDGQGALFGRLQSQRPSVAKGLWVLLPLELGLGMAQNSPYDRPPGWRGLRYAYPLFQGCP